MMAHRDPRLRTFTATTATASVANNNQVTLPSTPNPTPTPPLTTKEESIYVDRTVVGAHATTTVAIPRPNLHTNTPPAITTPQTQAHKTSAELVSEIHALMQEEREELTRVTQRLFILFHRNGRLSLDEWPEEDRIAMEQEQTTKKRIMEVFQNMGALIDGMEEVTQSMSRIAPTLPHLEQVVVHVPASAIPATATLIPDPIPAPAPGSSSTTRDYTTTTSTSKRRSEAEPPELTVMEFPSRKRNRTDEGISPADQDDDSSMPYNSFPLRRPPTPPLPHPTDSMPHHMDGHRRDHSYRNEDLFHMPFDVPPPVQRANPAIHAGRDLLDDTFPRFQRYPTPAHINSTQDPTAASTAGIPPPLPATPAYKIMSRPIDFLIALKDRAEKVYGGDFEYAYGFIISQATLDPDLRELFEVDFDYPNMSGWLWTQYEQRFVDLVLTPQEKQLECEAYVLQGRNKKESYIQYAERLARWRIMYRIEDLPEAQRIVDTLRASFPSILLAVLEVVYVQQCLVRYLGLPELDLGRMGVMDFVRGLGNLQGPEDVPERLAAKEAALEARKRLEQQDNVVGAGRSCSGPAGNSGGTGAARNPFVKNKTRPPPPARPAPAAFNRRYNTGYGGFKQAYDAGKEEEEEVAYVQDDNTDTASTEQEQSWPPPFRGRGRGQSRGRGRGRGGAPWADSEGGRGAYRGRGRGRGVPGTTDDDSGAFGYAHRGRGRGAWVEGEGDRGAYRERGRGRGRGAPGEDDSESGRGAYRGRGRGRGHRGGQGFEPYLLRGRGRGQSNNHSIHPAELQSIE
ncbi:MAG: hypothetical protein J3R72DRAFT_524137 [Linnemannia gamsii]|nr:MAG: hypothetical protein J3R72DRAFT_524137 [Linnemannia gamsii]